MRKESSRIRGKIRENFRVESVQCSYSRGVHSAVNLKKNFELDLLSFEKIIYMEILENHLDCRGIVRWDSCRIIVSGCLLESVIFREFSVTSKFFSCDLREIFFTKQYGYHFAESILLNSIMRKSIT